MSFIIDCIVVAYERKHQNATLFGTIEYMNEKTQQMKNEVKKQTFGYILTALGLVAGLAWNEAISATIKSLFPLDQNGLVPKFVYAVAVTILVVFLSKALLKISDTENK